MHATTTTTTTTTNQQFLYLHLSAVIIGFQNTECIECTDHVSYV